MNNSFIFTQPASVSGVESRGSRVESQSSTRRATAPAQPFSNVLDRAVQAPPKKVAEKSKQESLNGGRSAEHRSARSVEAREEHKPSALPRSSRRKDKQEDDVAMQSAASVTTPMPVVPRDEMVAAASASDPAIEGDIKVADCSSPKASTSDLASEIVPAKSEADMSSTKQAAAVNAELLSMMDRTDGAVENELVSELKPAELPTNQEPLPTSKNVQLTAETSSPTALPKTPTTEVATLATPDQAMSEMPEIPAATAREVALGVSRKESALVSQSGIPLTTTPVDAAVVESGAAKQIVPEELRLSARVDRGALTEMREKGRGTAAAKMTMSMNNEANREEIAGLTQQILPSGGVSQVATGINLPSEAQRAASKEISGVDSLNAAARLTTGPTRTDVSGSGELLDVRETSPAARLGEVISREVRMFKRGGDDMVEVVLTPDAKTQISLKLQWRDGQVEVQARCDMGDHRFLNTQWSQLQASFAAHGVRLSHLSERAHTGFTEFFSNSGFSQQQGGERQPAPQQTAIDAMKTAVPTPKTGAARSVVRSGNRLESWA